MNCAELISELTDICIRQAEIVQAQAYVLEQFGAEVKEEETFESLNRLRGLTGYLEEDDL